MGTELMNDRYINFVKYVIQKIKTDSSARAAFKKSDNPEMEYEALEYIVKFCNIENKYERKPFLLIAASIAKAKIDSNGKHSLGKAIAMCYKDATGEGGDNPARRRLRRLLACSDIDELCSVLRHILSLINSKEVSLNYADLLKDLLDWDKPQRVENIKIKWAKDFYKGE